MASQPPSSLASTPSTELKRKDARRVMGLLAPALGAPVASLWSSTLFGSSGSSSGGHRPADAAPRGRRSQFTVTSTEDALDGVLPCAAETFLAPMLQRNRFGDAAKLQFSMG